jgi:hypothetical protein
MCKRRSIEWVDRKWSSNVPSSVACQSIYVVNYSDLRTEDILPLNPPFFRLKINHVEMLRMHLQQFLQSLKRL